MIHAPQRPLSAVDFGPCTTGYQLRPARSPGALSSGWPGYTRPAGTNRRNGIPITAGCRRVRRWPASLTGHRWISWSSATATHARRTRCCAMTAPAQAPSTWARSASRTGGPTGRGHLEPGLELRAGLAAGAAGGIRRGARPATDRLLPAAVGPEPLTGRWLGRSGQAAIGRTAIICRSRLARCFRCRLRTCYWAETLIWPHYGRAVTSVQRSSSSRRGRLREVVEQPLSAAGGNHRRVAVRGSSASAALIRDSRAGLTLRAHCTSASESIVEAARRRAAWEQRGSRRPA